MSNVAELKPRPSTATRPVARTTRAKAPKPRAKTKRAASVGRDRAELARLLVAVASHRVDHEQPGEMGAATVRYLSCAAAPGRTADNVIHFLAAALSEAGASVATTFGDVAQAAWRSKSTAASVAATSIEDFRNVARLIELGADELERQAARLGWKASDR